MLSYQRVCGHISNIIKPSLSVHYVAYAWPKPRNPRHPLAWIQRDPVIRGRGANPQWKAGQSSSSKLPRRSLEWPPGTCQRCNACVTLGDVPAMWRILHHPRILLRFLTGAFLKWDARKIPQIIHFSVGLSITIQLLGYPPHLWNPSDLHYPDIIHIYIYIMWRFPKMGVLSNHPSHRWSF